MTVNSTPNTSLMETSLSASTLSSPNGSICPTKHASNYQLTLQLLGSNYSPSGFRSHWVQLNPLISLTIDNYIKGLNVNEVTENVVFRFLAYLYVTTGSIDNFNIYDVFYFHSHTMCSLSYIDRIVTCLLKPEHLPDLKFYARCYDACTKLNINVIQAVQTTQWMDFSWTQEHKYRLYVAFLIVRELSHSEVTVLKFLKESCLGTFNISVAENRLVSKYSLRTEQVESRTLFNTAQRDAAVLFQIKLHVTKVPPELRYLLEGHQGKIFHNLLHFFFSTESLKLSELLLNEFIASYPSSYGNNLSLEDKKIILVAYEQVLTSNSFCEELHTWYPPQDGIQSLQEKLQYDLVHIPDWDFKPNGKFHNFLLCYIYGYIQDFSCVKSKIDIHGYYASKYLPGTNQFKHEFMIRLILLYHNNLIDHSHWSLGECEQYPGEFLLR